MYLNIHKILRHRIEGRAIKKEEGMSKVTDKCIKRQLKSVENCEQWVSHLFDIDERKAG